jgi:hypothetical protein
VTSAEDNQRWIREQIEAHGWTEEVEAKATEMIMKGIDNMPDIPHGPDGPAHPNRICVCCKGSATKIMEDLSTTTYDNPSYICVDRELCRSVMIYEHMLTNTKGA